MVAEGQHVKASSRCPSLQLCACHTLTVEVGMPLKPSTEQPEGGVYVLVKGPRFALEWTVAAACEAMEFGIFYHIKQKKEKR